jgi:glycosyltransferase involved in cell wall biosynthesis
MDYLTGIGIEYGDRTALGRAAEYVVNHRDEAARMGQTAAQLIRTFLTWENVVSAHLRIYLSLWSTDEHAPGNGTPHDHRQASAP